MSFMNSYKEVDRSSISKCAQTLVTSPNINLYYKIKK